MSFTVNKSEYQWKEDLKVSVGNALQPDGWDSPGYLIESDWVKAQYRLQSARYSWISYAVNVELSERSKKVYFYPEHGLTKVRVKVTFVGDCEPDETVYGMMTL